MGVEFVTGVPEMFLYGVKDVCAMEFMELVEEVVAL
jgi:hypothetical protein